MNWPLGNPFEYNGPTLMTSFVVYPPNVQENALLTAYDAAVADLSTPGPRPEELDRIRSKMRSDWYDQLQIPVNRASALSHAVLFGDDPDRVYQMPDELARVTSDEVRAFARKYLVSTNRTIINRVPAAAAQAPGEKKGGQQ